MKLDLADTFLERLSSPSAMTSLRGVMSAATKSPSRQGQSPPGGNYSSPRAVMFTVGGTFDVTDCDLKPRGASQFLE
jgi:hypothetical protein